MLILDEIRATRDALRYGYAVGKVRVLETKMLDRSAVERLLDAREFGEQKRLLSDTAYGGYLEDAQTAEAVERALDDALDDFYRYLDDAELPSAVVHFFRVRYDYANLKAALKARAMGAPLAGLLVEHGTIGPSAFAEDLSELPDALAGIAADLAVERDPFAIDAAVDAAYFAEIVRLARAARSAYLVGLAALLIDVANIKTVLRAAAAGRSSDEVATLLIAGGTLDLSRVAARAEDGVRAVAEALAELPMLRGFSPDELADPSALDPAADALVASALRAGRREASGPEPVIAYVMGREAEVRTLRVLLLGTLTGIGFETLRARVGAAYR